MILYAESSAVLAWLLGESAGESVLESLQAADFIVTSELTLIECDRVLHRALAHREISREEAQHRRFVLRRAASKWGTLRVSHEIVERARQPFPEEPIRSLDAIHLATVLWVVTNSPEAALLSLDGRIRANAASLGLALLPAAEP